MFGQKFTRQRAGQPIAARTINRPVAALERALGLRPAAPLAQVEAFGAKYLRQRSPDRVKARLIASGGGGKYSWQGIYDTTGGGFADLDANISGTTTVDPCYEDNGTATHPAGTRVELERGMATGEWRFQLDHC